MNNLEQAQDPNTPARILDDLARENDWIIRATVAQNHNTWPITLVHLSRDPFWVVRGVVTLNPNVWDDTLGYLTHDKEGQVSRAAIRELVHRRVASIPEDVIISESKFYPPTTKTLFDWKLTLMLIDNLLNNRPDSYDVDTAAALSKALSEQIGGFTGDAQYYTDERKQ